MALIWDAPLVAAVARELEERLAGARLEAVHMDREARNVVLYFRESTLVFRLHPLHGDVALLDATDPVDEARKLRARLREIHAPPDERLLLIQLQPPGGGADPEGLVLELMTNQWNAVWLHVPTGRIRRVLWPRELSDRTLKGGETYQRPDPSERRGIDDPLTTGEWRDLVESEPEERRRGALLRGVAFTSSLNAAPLLRQPDGPDGAGDGPGPGYELWRRLRAVALAEEPADPRVLVTEKRFQPYPVALPGVESEARDTLLDAFGRAVELEEDSGAAEALVPAELLDRLEDEVRGAERKVDQLRTELEELPEPGPVRRTGDLILARFQELERGADEVTLEGFDGEPVTVELDPTLSPDENAKRHYERASRIERARRRLPELIEEAEGRGREIRALLDEARAGAVTPERIRAVLPERTGGRKGRSDEGPSLPYRRYRSSGGYEIRVGRGAKANDELTFHHSRPDDVWMHVRQAPGAHVILRWDGEGSPPPRDLAEAASLAALNSDARHSSTVPVDWTRRKYVRSPRKSAPGVVVPDRVQTVFVDPDPELERRLREGTG